MTSLGAYVFVVVCEADADRRTACGLADRVLCQEVPWIEPDSLDTHRSWRGLDAEHSYVKWSQTGNLFRKSGLKAHGHFDGRPGAPDAFAARRVLLLLRRRDFTPDGVVLIRDSDGDDLDRRTGLEQARAEWKEPIPIVLGLAHPKREAWVLAGFEPRDDEERERLLATRQALGFDPCLRAHQLLASETGALRDAKRVLASLTGGRAAREEFCWTECRLEVLEERGGENGLAAYVREVRERLVPLFTGRQA